LRRTIRRAVVASGDYVLDEFGKREAAVVRDLMPTLTEALELWLTSGITPVMNKFTGETV
jgi:peptidyl-tRNA hydrolase